MIEFLNNFPYKTYIGLLLSSLFASYWLAPKISWFAQGIRIRPRGHSPRKQQSPTLGGLAMGLPFIFGISLLLLLKNQVSENMYTVPLQMRGLLFGSCAILAVGIVQDLFNLKRPLRLVLQSAVAVIAYCYGFRIDPSVIGNPLLRPSGDLLLSLMWIVGLVNLLDLLYRLLPAFQTFLLLLILVLLGVAFSLDEYRTIIVCCLLAGSLLGHLSHTGPVRPALGSSGAYFAGFILAITMMQSGIVAGLVEILALVTTLLIVALLLLLRLPDRLTLHTDRNTTNALLKSMHYYRLAAELKLQTTTDPSESWDILCMAARELNYTGLSLQATSGLALHHWSASPQAGTLQSELTMPLSGGRLSVYGDAAIDSRLKDARKLSFTAIADAYDQSREQAILREADRPPNPCRALLVNRYYGGMAATGQLVEELAEDLAAAGIAVTVLTGDLGYESMSVLSGRNERIKNVHIRRILSTRFGRDNALDRMMDFAFFYLSSLAWIAKTAPYRYTHILTFTDPPLVAILGRIAQRTKKWRFIYCVQDLYPETARALGMMSQGPVFRLSQRLNRHLLNRADAVVAISGPMEDHIRSLANAQDSVYRITNWADPEKIRPVRAKDQSLLRELGLVDVYTAIYAGNMGMAQEIEALVEILKACSTNDQIQFIFMGDGTKRHLIEKAIEEYDIGNALLLPYQHKTTLERFLSLADIGIVSLAPALEGLAIPSKTYSYLAAGLPILALAAEHSELKEYAAAGLGAHFAPEATDSIAQFLAAQARGARRFSQSAIREDFIGRFARPILTGAYARLIRETCPPLDQRNAEGETGVAH